MILFALSVTAGLLAVIGCFYLLAAAILVGRFGRRRVATARASLPGTTILKPLHGDEPGLFDNLASFCAQDYPGPVQMICGVHGPTDPAVAVVRRLQAAHRDRRIDLVVDASMHGSNSKVSNLVNMSAGIENEVVVLADADIRVGPDYLSGVVAELQGPGVGGVTCLYYGVAASGLASRLLALGIQGHFLPNVIVGLACGLAQPCFGSTIAFTRRTLAEMGGFARFADCLADDYAVGAALRAGGRDVSIPPMYVAHVCGETSWIALWRHETRWARTVRTIDGRGYAGSIVTHPLPWAMISALLGGGLWSFGGGLALVAIICRVALVQRIARLCGLPAQSYWLLPVRDLLSFAVFVASFLSRSVSWKGRRFHVGSDGMMSSGGKATEP